MKINFEVQNKKNSEIHVNGYKRGKEAPKSKR